MSTSALQNPMLQTPSSLRAVLLSEPEARLRAPSSHASGLVNPRVLLAFTLCSVGVFLAALGFATAPTPPSWSLITAPKANPPQTLNGVACASASDCWAVSQFTGTLIEHWDGTAWSIVNSPNAGGPPVLNGVACSSASQCWAVGYYQFTYYDAYGHATVVVDQTLIEKWDGTSWTVVTSPNSGTSSFLTGVTCASASQCWAVGYYNNGSTTQTLTEEWNGTAWVIVPSANNGTNQPNFLDGVTCTSASDCWAVGYYNNGGVTQTLTEHWDGISWSVVVSPNTSSAQNNQLNGVTCASASDCWAAGTSNNSYVDQSLIARWDGTSWTIVTSPTPATGALLNRVTCASGSECWAVGKVSKIERTLIERWDGTSWAIATSPDLGGSLNDVTCVPGTGCWAVGNYNRQTLAQRWNGTSWAVVTSPNVPAPYLPNLTAVTCASASECWAVSSGSEIARWNGISWTVLNTPIPAGGVLTSVACSSPSACWAVGSVGYYSNTGRGTQTLIEQWNGTDWSIINSPDTGGTVGNNILYDVTCASASECWAVGYYASDIYRTLIEQWNGTAWAIVTSPYHSAAFNSLNTVTCASGSECWAIGYWTDNEVGGTLIEQWNGTSWSLVAAPDTSGVLLNSVACASASECWAVGGNGLIERWDGTAWAIFPSPHLGGQLSDVACTSPSECWAVGNFDAGNDIGKTLIERWDGSSWSVAPSPNLGTQNSGFSGVACASSSDCWAVGIDTNNLRGTLIEKYSSTIPPLASVVSRKVHGNAGTFDINLPLTGTRGVECRSPGATGTPGIDYKLVFSFINNVTSCGTASTGSLSDGPNSNQCTVNLTGVSNQQYTTVTLNNVLDSQNNTGNVSATMGVLVGDVNANGVVTNADVSLVKAQVASGASVGLSNFRDDINANGLLSNADVSLTKAQVAAGAQLPSPP